MYHSFLIHSSADGLRSPCEYPVTRSPAFQGVVTGRVHNAAARFPFRVWVGCKQSRKEKKVAFLGGRGGWTGGEETAEVCASCCFPGRFPPPTDAKPRQTAALRSLWFLGWGTAPCKEAAAGNPTDKRVAHQMTFASSSSPDRAPILGCRRFHGAFSGVRLDREILVTAAGDQALQDSGGLIY